MEIESKVCNGNVDSVKEHLKHDMDEIVKNVDKLNQKVNEVEQFYSDMSKIQQKTSKVCSVVNEKDEDKHFNNLKKKQRGASHSDGATGGKGMQLLMHQFFTIFNQITHHSWAQPFMHPVDVEGLGLHDYHQVIEKPMDLSTIKYQMEATDGTRYKNVREIYADVRLVFKNAMKYNDERSDVYVMAQNLLSKFEAKWLELLPKVVEEEKLRVEEKAEAQLETQIAQEAAHAKMARDLSNEIYEVEKYLEEFREMVVRKCRTFTTEDKKRLGSALARLSHEDILKALDIIAENNPSFEATSEEVNIDLDIQSESTLWRLKVFVKDALKVEAKSCGGIGEGNNDHGNNKNHTKRRRMINDALTTNAIKRTKNF